MGDVLDAPVGTYMPINNCNYFFSLLYNISPRLKVNLHYLMVMSQLMYEQLQEMFYNLANFVKL